MRTAQAYLLSGPEETVMDADVSTSRRTGMRLGASYSFTKTLPVRALTRQSMDFTGSPGT